MKNPDLSGAYALDGPDTVRDLYANWAETYDSGFARGMDYRLPAEVARAFVDGGAPVGPVLDIGAGTGLLAAALRGLGFSGPIDALDLSAEMLRKSAQKGLYRQMIEADVTQPFAHHGPYAGIVSSGTFTHGHVGADALPNLLDVAQPGCVVSLSVNAAIWDDKGFDRVLSDMKTHIADVTVTEVAIYGDAARELDPEHADDVARILRYRIP